MLAAFQGLSWLQRWKGTPDSQSVRSQPRRRRARFRVEALEPRWLLSTTAGGEAESNYTILSADYTELPSSSTVSYQFQVSKSDDWSNAELMPAALNVQVNGSFGPGSAPDLFEIQVESWVSSLDFLLKSASDAQWVTEGIQVFDADLNGLVNYSASPTNQAIQFKIFFGIDKPTSVFVRIAPPAGTENLSGLAANSSAYVLEITRHWPLAGGQCGPPGSSPIEEEWYPFDSNYPDWATLNIATPGGGNGGGTGATNGPETNPNPEGPDYGSGYSPVVGPDPLPYGNHPPLVGPAPLPPYQPSQNQGEDFTKVPYVIAVGPLPARSSAPLGGALATTDSTPLVDRHEPARADLAEFDPDLALEDVDPRPPQLAPGEERDAAPVITLRGPGGLPLLATALIAGSAVTVRTDTEGTPAQREGKAEAAEVDPTTATVVGQVQASSLSAESTPSSGTKAESSKQGTKRSHRSSVVPGLTLAFALGVALVLPDLVASLQFNAPLRPLLRLRLIRRAIKGR